MQRLLFLSLFHITKHRIRWTKKKTALKIHKDELVLNSAQFLIEVPSTYKGKEERSSLSIPQENTVSKRCRHAGGGVRTCLCWWGVDVHACVCRIVFVCTCARPSVSLQDACHACSGCLLPCASFCYQLSACYSQFCSGLFPAGNQLNTYKWTYPHSFIKSYTQTRLLQASTSRSHTFF